MRLILDIAGKIKKETISGWLMGTVCKAQREKKKTGCAAALGTEFFEEKSNIKKN